MLKIQLLFLLFLIAKEVLSEINDPYKHECATRKIYCHPKAICQLDEMTSDFYCRCLPGYKGDGTNFCQDLGFYITASNTSVCDGYGQQVCLIRVTGRTVTFSVSVITSGHSRLYTVIWYKFYTGQSPQFQSFRRTLAPVKDMVSVVAVADRGHVLTLLSIGEDDFYPNLFWAEVKKNPPTATKSTVEAYDLSDFQLLNPSNLRYFFVLDSMPVEIGKFLEGDTVTIRLPQYLQLSESSLVTWVKDPQPLTLLDRHAVVLANDIERLELKVLMESDFGYIRALVYDFSPDVPGRVLVAQRLFLIKKDVSKTCSGSRSEANCRCNLGFEGNGVHCVDINECKRVTPLPCLPEAHCINTEGSYFCQCPKGSEGDGLLSCIDIDECTRGTHDCTQDATCLNTLGSYLCVCQSGYIGDGVQCRAKSAWSPWSPWSPCSATCGLQNQMRIRECTHLESGMRCLGPSSDLSPCPNLQPCPVNGHWSEWSPWSMCSETCAGIRKRVRVCNSPAPARGGLPCKGEKEELKLCSSKNCPVDGMWSSWTSWTLCPISCGLGFVSRSRYCNSPAPAHGGHNCSGHSYEEASCGFPEAFCKYLVKPSDSVIPGKLIN